MDLLSIFAANMKRIREAKGLSQEALGAEAGVHRTYISGVERRVRNPTVTGVGILLEWRTEYFRELFFQSVAGWRRGIKITINVLPRMIRGVGRKIPGDKVTQQKAGC